MFCRYSEVLSWTMNNLLSYCGLVNAKIRASDKDLPVILALRFQDIFSFSIWQNLEISISTFYLFAQSSEEWIQYHTGLVKHNVIQWIFDLRKFLGTAKNFLKSKIFLKSNTPSSLKYANWKYYSYFYDPIY